MNKILRVCLFCSLFSLSLFYTFEPFPWGNGMWWHLNELQRITRTIVIIPMFIALVISYAREAIT